GTGISIVLLSPLAPMPWPRSAPSSSCGGAPPDQQNPAAPADRSGGDRTICWPSCPVGAAGQDGDLTSPAGCRGVVGRECLGHLCARDGPRHDGCHRAGLDRSLTSRERL